MACIQQRAPRLLLQLAQLGGAAPGKLWPGQLAALATQHTGAARFKDSFQAPPHSLESDRGRVTYPPALEGNPLGRALLTLIGARSQRQRLSNGASILYYAIEEAAGDAALQEAVGLDPDAFMTSHSLLALHVWLVVNRLKGEDRALAAPFQQALYSDYFYRDTERRVYKDGSVKLRVGATLKQLERVTYSGWVAYDAALAGDRATFADALVRFVYGGDATMRPSAALLGRYLLRQAGCLELTPAEAVYKGHVKFSPDVVKA